MTIELKLPHTEVCGYYKIEAYSKSRGRRVLADWFPNLITNNGLNLFGTSFQYLAACQVGTGSTAPNVNDESLASYLAGTATLSAASNGNQSTAPYFAWRRNTYRFDIGVAAGNISEVGISTRTASGNLFSRALILDSSGNPTVITVLSDEILDVTYEFRVYAPTADATGTFQINSVDYDYTARPSIVTSSGGWGIATTGTANLMSTNISAHRAYNGTIGSVTDSPSGADAIPDSATPNAYSSGSHTASGTLRWGLSTANFPTGVSAASVQMGTNTYQFQFDPPIVKNNTQILDLVFSTSWARKIL